MKESALIADKMSLYVFALWVGVLYTLCSLNHLRNILPIAGP